MRLIQYINEVQYNPHAKASMKGVQTVYTHCMPYIKDIIKSGFNYLSKDDDLLYSGRNDNKSVISKNVRKDRKPTDMEEDLFNFYDKAFYKKFGIKGRSNSIFCTGRYHVAMGYGSTPYIIFPAGKYNVLWSDQIRDLYNNSYSSLIIEQSQIDYYTYINTVVKPKDPNKTPTFWDASDKIPAIKNFKKEMDKKIISTYHKGDVVRAIDSGNEIMLQCKYYIGLKYMDFNRIIKQYIEQKGTTYPTEEIYYEWYNRYIDEI